MKKKQGSATDKTAGRTSTKMHQGASRTREARNGECAKSELEGSPQRPPAKPEATTGGAREVPAGLDAARHAAAQRAAHGAEVLRERIFPALMASALAYEKQGFDGSACQVYLEELLREAGNPSDPIERMLIQQLGLAHYRIAALHADAGQTTAVPAAKILNSLAARMLGEFRRTALALRAYRSGVPEAKPEKLKIYKAAQ